MNLLTITTTKTQGHEAHLVLQTYESPLQQFVHPYFIAFHPPRVSLKTSNVLSHHDHVLERLVGDIVIGCSVTAVVSPFLTVIDKALVQKSAGSHTVVGSMLGSVSAMIRNPIAYFKSPTFLWMWATYAATYSVANSIKTLSEHQQYVTSTHHSRASQASSTNSSSSDAATALALKKKSDAMTNTAIFLGTTMANTTACLAKDRAYAKLFGNPAATKVPKVSYVAWLLRDFSVIGSSFILPDYVAPLVKDSFDVSDNTARHIAQVGTPMAAQLIAGPLHFLGLDCFNRDLSHMGLTTRVLDRGHFLAKTFKDVALARIIRVLPGYGVAGVFNTKLRNQWRERVMIKEVREILDKNCYSPHPRGTTATRGIHALL